MSLEIIEFLEKAPLFRALPEKFRRFLVEHSDRRDCGVDEVIFRKGELGEHVYIILKGKVAVLDEDEVLDYSAELDRRGAGGVLGLASVIGGLPRTATCRSVEPTVLMALERRVVMGLLERVPKFAVEVSKWLASWSHTRLRQQAPGPARSVTSVRYEPEVYDLIPHRILEQYRMIPFDLSDGALTVATPDPGNITAIDDVSRFLHGAEVKPVFINESDYRRFMQRHFKDAKLASRGVQPTGGMPAVGRSAGWRAASTGGFAVGIDYLYQQQDDKQPVSGGDPVAELDEIVLEALHLQASDIHIEPVREGLVVRYRVDGVLQERPKKIGRGILRPLVARVKVLGGADISESRVPQDGRFSFGVGEHLYDMRVSTMPTVAGEKVVLRILDTEQASVPLEDLFVLDRACKLVKRLVHKPFGLLITTGPTGSGKTTTLYASLHERRATRVNITTVEDPVEYYVPGVNQVQVSESIGRTYPTVLRGIMRQNPDIILVGEMRDAATARISLEAGLTGHLVLTSLHANTAVGALLRLLDMDLDPFTIGHTVNGIVNQRLVRKICPSCKAPYEYRPDIVSLLTRAGIFATGFDGYLSRGRGCDDCAGTGLRGRVALFEVLTMTETLRGVLGRGRTAEELTTTAKESGFISLQQYASHALLAGLTTPEEVFRAIGSPSQK